MSRTALFIALLLAGAAQAAAAEDLVAPTPRAEAVAAGRAATARAERIEKKGGAGAAVLAAVTPEEVGDADSFGRNVKWLGLLSAYVYLAEDCTPAPGDPVDPRCITVNPAPAATVINAPDLATITLPGRSAETLLCHWQTPIVQVSFANFTVNPGNYQFRVTPTYRFESEVLDDPTLIDPATGLPFGGQINTGLSAINQSGSIEPGEHRFESITGTRMCIGGIITKANLMNQYGLSEAQARKFFKKPITITIGLTGNARMVDGANINFGTRFTGD